MWPVWGHVDVSGVCTVATESVAGVAVPAGARTALLRRAEESLERHQEGPDGMCMWCVREWRQRIAYPCEFVAIALGVKRMFERDSDESAR